MHGGDLGLTRNGVYLADLLNRSRLAGFLDLLYAVRGGLVGGLGLVQIALERRALSLGGLGLLLLAFNLPR